MRRPTPTADRRPRVAIPGLIIVLLATMAAIPDDRANPWPDDLSLGFLPAGFEAAGLDANHLVVNATNPCVILDTNASTEPTHVGAYGDATRDWPTAASVDLTAFGGTSGCGLSPDAQAIIINLVAVTPSAPGNLKAWPASEPEPPGGVVNFSKLKPAFSNSNAFVVAVGADVDKTLSVKVNKGPTHVRGIMLGELVSADDLYAPAVEPAELPDAIAVSVTDPAASDDPTCGDVATPCRTITHGLGRAITAFKSRVVVAAGTYWEEVTAVDGIDLEGGWALDFASRNPAIHHSEIRAVTSDGVSFAAANITSPTEVSGFVIVGADASTPGATSIAVLVEDSDADLVITANEIRAGDGADGSAGSPGTNGSDGDAGDAGSDSGSAPIPGGDGGVTSGGGNGGDGGDSTAPVFDAPNGAGINGTSQDGSAGGDGGDGGENASWASSQCTTILLPDSEREGSPGLQGDDGAHGSAGVGGSGGVLVGSGWFTAAGTGGTSGDGGGGGGGGGAGGGIDNPYSCSETAGPSGGGGGAGGAGGSHGTGGAGGGASIAILVLGGSPGSLPTIVDNVITLGRGGDGGHGGNGGVGGAGGLGGAGGAALGITTRDAGDGANGGDGGHGGGGGGGAGGDAIGLLSEFGPLVLPNTYVPAGAAGGNGGLGGLSIGNGGGAGTAGSVFDELVP